MSWNLSQHEDVKVIEGEGMPVYGDPFTKGNLIINFEVVFPSEVTAQNKMELSLKVEKF